MKKLLLLSLVFYAFTFNACKKEDKASVTATWRVTGTEQKNAVGQISTVPGNVFLQLTNNGNYYYATSSSATLTSSSITSHSSGSYTRDKNYISFDRELISAILKEGSILSLTDTKLKISVEVGETNFNVYFSKEKANLKEILDQLPIK